MAHADEIEGAVERYIMVNSDSLTSRASREQAFDDLFKILCDDELPIQPVVHLGIPENSGHESPVPSLLDLPPELHLRLISYLNWHTIISLRLVSCYWRDIITPYGVHWRTSLLSHRLQSQELNRHLELRLDELIFPPGSPWISHQRQEGKRPSWMWAARYPCYTCMRWLHNHHFVSKTHLAGQTYRRRYLFLSNRWPVSKTTGDYWYVNYGVPVPAVRLSYDTKDKEPVRSGIFKVVTPKTRMCIQCAAKKDFLPNGHLPGLLGCFGSQWIVCMCKKVFWRSDRTIPNDSEYDDLVQWGPNPPSEESPWRSFWWCGECNAAGLSKENWLLWAHELRIGATEARLERLEGEKIAQGRQESCKRWCPIVKEERYCRCANWFIQEVWDGLAWKGSEKVQSAWGEYEKEPGISWVKWECRRALAERRVRLRPSRKMISTSRPEVLAIRNSIQ